MPDCDARACATRANGADEGTRELLILGRSLTHCADDIPGEPAQDRPNLANVWSSTGYVVVAIRVRKQIEAARNAP